MECTSYVLCTFHWKRILFWYDVNASLLIWWSHTMYRTVEVKVKSTKNSDRIRWIAQYAHPLWFHFFVIIISFEIFCVVKLYFCSLPTYGNEFSFLEWRCNTSICSSCCWSLHCCLTFDFIVNLNVSLLRNLVFLCSLSNAKQTKYETFRKICHKLLRHEKTMTIGKDQMKPIRNNHYKWANLSFFHQIMIAIVFLFKIHTNSLSQCLYIVLRNL